MPARYQGRSACCTWQHLLYFMCAREGLPQMLVGNWAWWELLNPKVAVHLRALPCFRRCVFADVNPIWQSHVKNTINGMEKYRFNILSSKIEVAMSHSQNLLHFPSFICATLIHPGNRLLSLTALNKFYFGFFYLTYSFLGAELLYDPVAFQDLFAITEYWQLTDFLKICS